MFVEFLNYDEMVSDCSEVLRTLVFRQTEVQKTKQGQWFLLRIMPYRTAENIIDGLVPTFVDINLLKQAQKSLRRLSKVFTDGLDPIVIIDLQGRIVDLKNEVVRNYGWTRDDLLGQPVAKMVPRTDHRLLEERLEQCRKGETVRSVESRRVDKSGREHKGLLTLSLLTDELGAPEAIALTIQHTPD
jgi:two-component system CheB/CheR fusion protein